MFKKKPTTVTEAVAPFKEVQQNLRQVVKGAVGHRNEHRRRVEVAERHLATVRKDAQAEQDLAGQEIDQAEKILAALAAIVGEG